MIRLQLEYLEPSYSKFSLEDHSFPLQEAIERIALKVFTELVISFALGALCCAFAAPASVSLIISTVALQCVLNTAIRTAIAYFEVQAKSDATFKPPEPAYWLTPYRFSQDSLANVQTIIHEKGHGFAANALLKNANPQIELFPYKGGVTTFEVSEASELGKKIGLERIHPLVAGAGPLLALGVSTICLATGLSVQEKYPELSRILILSAILDFMVHALYAFSALIASPLDIAHDFAVLWRTAAIHPVAATIAILAIPILILQAWPSQEKKAL